MIQRPAFQLCSVLGEANQMDDSPKRFLEDIFQANTFKVCLRHFVSGAAKVSHCESRQPDDHYRFPRALTYLYRHFVFSFRQVGRLL